MAVAKFDAPDNSERAEQIGPEGPLDPGLAAAALRSDNPGLGALGVMSSRAR
ncbi:hypothetical protein [Ramlibacter sp.]|uniref:hypothetical protein n=1 Tax=Ramlibacter sp. TaxID=1917967 RepID=UPI003D14985F